MTSYLEIIKRKQIEWINMRDIVVINRIYDTPVDKLNKAKKEKKMMSFILNTATYRKN